MERHDVLIIGGGLVGCGAAYYLGKRGVRACVLERGDINRQASGRNAGSLHFQLEHRLIEHGDALAAQFAQVIPLNLLAIEEWAGLERELDADLEIVLHGGLMLAETDRDVALLEKKFALEQKWDLPTSLLSQSDVRAQAPYLDRRVVAAGYCPQEGHANPRLVTLAYARAAALRGAEIRTGVEVAAIAREGRGWRVQTKRGGVTQILYADSILNAAGAWAGDIARFANLHLPIFPVPLTMNITEARAPMISHFIQHAGRKLSMKQVRDGHILIGGGWPSRFHKTRGAIDTDKTPYPVRENVVDNLRTACAVVPALADCHLLRVWTGATGVTPDQLPILGEVPEAPGFYVAAGGSGFTLGPVYARLIAELIAGGAASHQIDIYSPRRFSHINSFMGSAYGA